MCLAKGFCIVWVSCCVKNECTPSFLRIMNLGTAGCALLLLTKQS